MVRCLPEGEYSIPSVFANSQPLSQVNDLKILRKLRVPILRSMWFNAFTVLADDLSFEIIISWRQENMFPCPHDLFHVMYIGQHTLM